MSPEDTDSYSPRKPDISIGEIWKKHDSGRRVEILDVFLRNCPRDWMLTCHTVGKQPYGEKWAVSVFAKRFIRDSNEQRRLGERLLEIEKKIASGETARADLAERRLERSKMALQNIVDNCLSEEAARCAMTALADIKEMK